MTSADFLASSKTKLDHVNLPVNGSLHEKVSHIYYQFIYTCIPTFAVPLTSDYGSLRTPLRLAKYSLIRAIGELPSP